MLGKIWPGLGIGTMEYRLRRRRQTVGNVWPQPGYQHHLGVWSLYNVTELTCYVQSVPLLKDPELPCLGSSGLP